MCPLRLIEPALTGIYSMASDQSPAEDRIADLAGFALWLGGSVFLLLLGRAVGGAQKDMVNYLLDIATPGEIPVRIPQVRRRNAGGE